MNDSDRRAALKAALGRQLRTLREARSWTRPHLADLADTTHHTLLTYEHGLRLPPITMLVDVCQALGVSTADVLQAALQQVDLDRDHMLVDLHAVIDDTRHPDDAVLARWARHRLASGTRVARMTPDGLVELAAVIGCTISDLTSSLLPYTPDPEVLREAHTARTDSRVVR